MKLRRLILASALIASLVALTLPSRSQGLLVVQRRQVAAPSGPLLVQQATATAADGSGGQTASFDNPPIAGNGIIFQVSYVSSTTITDCNLSSDDGSPLTLAISSTVAGVTTDIWYILNISDTNIDGVRWHTADAVRTSGNAAEFSNLADFAPVVNSGSGTSNTIASGSVTPATPSNLIVAIGASDFSNFSTGPTNGFTAMTSTGGLNSPDEAVLVSGAGTSAVNGIFAQGGTGGGKPYYVLLGQPNIGVPAPFTIDWDGGTPFAWEINDGDGVPVYFSLDAVAHPWQVTTWVSVSPGVDPVPATTQQTGVGVFQRSAFLIQSSATAKSTGYGLSSSSNWAAAIAAFRGQ